jgi:hypothetical protein
VRPRLWQDMMGQDTTLEAWRVILETRNGVYVMIAVSAGEFDAMNPLNTLFEEGSVSRELIDSTLKAYTISFAGMGGGAGMFLWQNGLIPRTSLDGPHSVGRFDQEACRRVRRRRLIEEEVSIAAC